METCWIKYYRRVLGADNVYNISSGGDDGWAHINDLKITDPEKYRRIQDKVHSESAELNRVNSKRSSGFYESDAYKRFTDAGNSKDSRKKAYNSATKSGFYGSDGRWLSINKLGNSPEARKKSTETKRSNSTLMNAINAMNTPAAINKKAKIKHLYRKPDGEVVSCRPQDYGKFHKNKGWIDLGIDTTTDHGSD